jgi:hypothetical protein
VQIPSGYSVSIEQKRQKLLSHTVSWCLQTSPREGCTDIQWWIITW